MSVGHECQVRGAVTSLQFPSLLSPESTLILNSFLTVDFDKPAFIQQVHLGLNLSIAGEMCKSADGDGVQRAQAWPLTPALTSS